jgi:hypothetical protein
MKNVHIVPTDKPSRLCIDNSCDELNYSEKEGLNSKHITNQCMYITSDEVIKEGDWVVTPNKTIMLVTTKYTTESSFMIGNSKHKGSPYYIEFCRKIILTTDQSLDGVQAIDDEFLEWFVKNPSCEFVEAMFACRGFNGVIPNLIPIGEYKIIIPQEEPKQELERGITITHVSKQETLEEAAKNYGNSIGNKDGTAQFDFIRGAKWQAERMYGEEEVKKIAEEVRWQAIGNPLEFTKNFNKWFEQFKKK